MPTLEDMGKAWMTPPPPGEVVDGSRCPVWLHVYDLGPVTKWILNSWAAAGAFHCGVEVLGIEWSYQALSGSRSDSDDISGLTWHQPRSHPRHVFRESVWLGSCPLKVADISRLLDACAKLWPARAYHFLKNNCTDFAEHFTSTLQLDKPFPVWVHGLAKGVVHSGPSSISEMAMSPLFIPCCGSCGSDGFYSKGGPHVPAKGLFSSASDTILESSREQATKCIGDSEQYSPRKSRGVVNPFQVLSSPDTPRPRRRVQVL